MAKNQISKNSLKKLLDSVTPMAPDAAEKFVRDLLKVGDERRRDAEKIVAEVATVARRSAEQFSVTVQKEVAKQLGRLVVRIDQVEKQVETLNKNLEATRALLVAAAAKGLSKSTATTKSSSTTTAKPAAKKPAAKKPAVKKPAVKKPATKKPAAKKSTAKKSPAKKPVAKKSAAPKS
jgi:peptidoglycan hydrolase CwlO-like protein